MYRVYNAAFVSTSQTWAPKNSLLPAYATVQGSDGSIHHYILNPSGTWDGSDNNTVFNGVDFGMIANDTSVDNSAALQNAIEAAIDLGGGTIFIPSGTYTFTNGVNKTATSAEDVGIIIAGTGGGSELVYSPSGGGTLFTFDNFSTTGNGIRLRNLRLTYESPTTTGVAVSLTACQNITCQEVFFGDWSTAFSTDPRSGQCGLIDCTIQYDNGLPGQTMISLQGSQEFVIGCVIRETTMSPPSACYGILIQGSNGFTIDNVQISDFDYGLKVTDSARDSFVANTLIYAQVSAVQVQPTDQLKKINNICFSNCVFAANQTTGGTGAKPGVIITANGGADSNVAGIVFNNCTAYGWGGAGIEVDQGQNIVISGGQFSSNGQKSTDVNLAAGIAIAGGSLVTISGADCSGVNELWQEKGTGAVTQPTGIAISNDQSPVSDVTINGCNLQGNATNAVLVAQSGTKTIDTVLIRGCNATDSLIAAVTVTGTPTALEVIDCAGYNDLGLLLGHAVPSVQPFSNTSSWTNALNGWFGPIVFYVVSNGDVTIDGYDTQLKQGGFTLSPGEYASIAGTITHFLAFGR
jgi:hypothetical protein